MVRILITGDTAPVERLEHQCMSGNVEALVGSFRQAFADADLRITNLECPLTAATDSIRKTGSALKANPACIDLVNRAGFDLVTLANNHIRDYGDRGVHDTLRVCAEHGIRTVGAGKNIREASEPVHVPVGEACRITVLNYAEREFCVADRASAGANPWDPIHACYDLRDARQNSDFVIVIVHGGNEYYPLPSPRLKKAFRFLADMGASAVVGHHPHVAGGYEVYNGVPIFYSLGNFLFDDPETTQHGWSEGIALALNGVSGGGLEPTIHPVIQCRNGDLRVRVMEGEAREVFLREIAALSEMIADDVRLEREWVAFTRRNSRSYLRMAFQTSILERVLLRSGIRNTPKRIASDLPRILNLIRCESHRDVLLDVLEHEATKTV